MSTQRQQPWYMQGGVATNVSLADMRARARRLLTNDAYLANLKTALIDRTCPPQIEALLYAYAYGKPVENVNVNVVQNDLSTLSIAELERWASDIMGALSEAKALEDALPGAFDEEGAS